MGKTNLGDYATKHHQAIHHQATRGTFLTDISKLIELWNRQKGYAVTLNSCSKGVLDKPGPADTASDYENALEARKLPNAIDIHSDRHTPQCDGHAIAHATDETKIIAYLERIILLLILYNSYI